MNFSSVIGSVVPLFFVIVVLFVGILYAKHRRKLIRPRSFEGAPIDVNQMRNDAFRLTIRTFLALSAAALAWVTYQALVAGRDVLIDEQAFLIVVIYGVAIVLAPRVILAKALRPHLNRRQYARIIAFFVMAILMMAAGVLVLLAYHPITRTLEADKEKRSIQSSACDYLTVTSTCTVGKYDWKQKRCIARAAEEGIFCAEGNVCRAGVCVADGKLPSTEEAYAQSQKRRILSTPNVVTGFQINLNAWMTMSELNDVLVEEPLRITQLHLLMPDVLDGLRIAVLLSDEPRKLDDLQKPIEKSSERFISLNPELVANVRTAAAKGNVLIGSFRARGLPSDALKLWTNRPDAVRFVQTIETEIDKAQQAFEPGLPL